MYELYDAKIVQNDEENFGLLLHPLTFLFFKFIKKVEFEFYIAVRPGAATEMDAAAAFFICADIFRIKICATFMNVAERHLYADVGVAFFTVYSFHKH